MGVSRKPDQMMFGKGAGKMVVQKRGGKGRDRVVAVAVERKSLGLDSWAFFLAEVNLLNSVILCRLWLCPFKWGHYLPTGLGGALGSVKVLKLFSIAQQ